MKICTLSHDPLGIIIEYVGDPQSTVPVCRGWAECTNGVCGEFWYTMIKGPLSHIAAFWVKALGQVHPIPPDWMQSLRLARKLASPIPPAQRPAPRLSLQYYEDLAAAHENISLERAWQKIHPKLLESGAANLPKLDASAAAIRTWINDPVNNAAVAAVQRLDLRFCQLLVVPQEINRFINLTNLDLSNNLIKMLSSGQFSSLGNLQRLSLCHNKIQIIDINALRGCLNLQKLWLSDNQIQKIEDVLRSCSHLQALDLAHNPILSQAIDALRIARPELRI